MCVGTECIAWGAAQYGRSALAEITREVDGKSEEEVREYAKAFWARYKELNDWERVIKNIERGEQRIQRQEVHQHTNTVKQRLPLTPTSTSTDPGRCQPTKSWCKPLRVFNKPF